MSGQQDISNQILGQKNIGEQCTEKSLEELHEAFLATENERMNEPQLQDAIRDILKINYEAKDMHTLFLKINSGRNGFVTWDEFISYILLEFQDKDASWQWQTLEPPLAGIPIVLKNHHRSPISRILFCPEVLPDRTSNFLSGCYITASADGLINYWSLDLKYERSVNSVNPFLKVCPSIITDVIVMPDVQIVCTSSTELDLRFYDIAAKKFDLRLVISRLESAVVCMGYHFNVDVREGSYILLGDTSGSVIVMSFNPSDKGPFKHLLDQDGVGYHLYTSILKGELSSLKVTEFKNVHTNWVNQIAYFVTLRAFISCSRCSKCSLFLSDPTGTKMTYKFVVEKGLSCFTFCEESQLLMTGGPDCSVRLWNPFVTNKPSIVLRGHHAAICAIVSQNSGTRLYTVAKDRCIKVWDVGTQACIQTYNNLPSELGEHTELSIIYEDITHKMIIASMVIAVIVCDKVIDQDASDGFTHSQPVSCVLYNSLFRVIVSVGLDSCIIVWDPWLGRRLFLVTKAHSQLHLGQLIGIEITAASFDPSQQLLLTGARDGSLKMWNFNTGTCLRKMSIDENCEVTSIVWLKNRILCAGWNRRVTEFADSETGVHKKNWEIRHTEYILCASATCPQALATASYNGEIVLWRLETAQPYRRYQVSDPTRRYKIVYKKEPKQEISPKVVKKRSMKRSVTSKIIGPTSSTIIHSEDSTIETTALGITRTVAARSIIFLSSRESNPETGSLLVSLESGLIQVWTHHTAAGFLAAFTAIHTEKDYAQALATDPENEFLITGHAAGYIKVWLLKNYVLSNPPKVSIPLLRLEFPFLWQDRIVGRAKRAIKDQKWPLLLTSVKGHTRAINSVEFIQSAQIIISGSDDHTVRLWTLSGRYISTLGTFRPWLTLNPETPANVYLTNCRIPPDIKRIGSSTTMKVLRGGLAEEVIEDKAEKSDGNVEISEDDKEILYGAPFDTKILDEYYDLLTEERIHEKAPILDNSLAYIPVYTHLTTHEFKTIEVPKKPAFLKKPPVVRSLLAAVSKFKKTASSTQSGKKGQESSSVSIGLQTFGEN